LINTFLPPEQISILAGSSGVGKTTLVLQLLKASQDGDDFCGFAISSQWRIGIISADRGWSEYEETAKRVGTSLDGIKHVSLIDDLKIDLKAYGEDAFTLLCDKLIPQLLPLDLLIVDPLSGMLATDLGKYHKVSAKLLMLGRILKQYHLSALGLWHAAAARTDFTYRRPQDRINGSKSGILGFTATQMFLESAEERGEVGHPHHRWVIQSHHSEPRIVFLELGATGFAPSQNQILVGNVALPNQIVDFFAIGQDLETGFILSAFEPLGFSRRTIERTLQALTKDGRLTRSAQGVYHRPPLS
jgi:hypothetical protein